MKNTHYIAPVQSEHELMKVFGRFSIYAKVTKKTDIKLEKKSAISSRSSMHAQPEMFLLVINILWLFILRVIDVNNLEIRPETTKLLWLRKLKKTIEAVREPVELNCILVGKFTYLIDRQRLGEVLITSF